MSEQGASKKIKKQITSGDYDLNLRLAMKWAAMAVDETSTAKETYLLSQSLAQSAIAMVLLLEELVGHTTYESNGESNE